MSRMRDGGLGATSDSGNKLRLDVGLGALFFHWAHGGFDEGKLHRGVNRIENNSFFGFGFCEPGADLIHSTACWCGRRPALMHDSIV